MGLAIRRPYHSKSGKLYMMDAKGRLSFPTANQKKLYGKKRSKK